LDGYISIEELFSRKHYSKSQIVEIFRRAVTSFNHLETGKYLDEKCKNMYGRIKRIFDVIVSFMALLALSPFLIIILLF